MNRIRLRNTRHKIVTLFDYPYKRQSRGKYVSLLSVCKRLSKYFRSTSKNPGKWLLLGTMSVLNRCVAFRYSKEVDQIYRDASIALYNVDPASVGSWKDHEDSDNECSDASRNGSDSLDTSAHSDDSSQSEEYDLEYHWNAELPFVEEMRGTNRNSILDLAMIQNNDTNQSEVPTDMDLDVDNEFEMEKMDSDISYNLDDENVDANISVDADVELADFTKTYSSHNESDNSVEIEDNSKNGPKYYFLTYTIVEVDSLTENEECEGNKTCDLEIYEQFPKSEEVQSSECLDIDAKEDSSKRKINLPSYFLDFTIDEQRTNNLENSLDTDVSEPLAHTLQVQAEVHLEMYSNNEDFLNNPSHNFMQTDVVRNSDWGEGNILEDEEINSSLDSDNSRQFQSLLVQAEIHSQVPFTKALDYNNIVAPMESENLVIYEETNNADQEKQVNSSALLEKETADTSKTINSNLFHEFTETFQVQAEIHSEMHPFTEQLVSNPMETDSVDSNKITDNFVNTFLTYTIQKHADSEIELSHANKTSQNDHLTYTIEKESSSDTELPENPTLVTLLSEELTGHSHIMEPEKLVIYEETNNADQEKDVNSSALLEKETADTSKTVNSHLFNEFTGTFQVQAEIHSEMHSFTEQLVSNPMESEKVVIYEQTNNSDQGKEVNNSALIEEEMADTRDTSKTINSNISNEFTETFQVQAEIHSEMHPFTEKNISNSMETESEKSDEITDNFVNTFLTYTIQKHSDSEIELSHENESSQNNHLTYTIEKESSSENELPEDPTLVSLLSEQLTGHFYYTDVQRTRISDHPQFRILHTKSNTIWMLCQIRSDEAEAWKKFCDPINC